MFKTTRRSAARLATAGIAAGLLAAGALATAGAALADGVTPSSSGATAVLKGLEPGKYDTAVVDGDPGNTVAAGLFEMSVAGGGTIETYCIDFNHHTQPSASYNEVAWGDSTLGHNPNAGKIAWILNNSYPKVDAAALASTLKAGGVNLDHPLTDALAAAGTQVAIWHLSDPEVHVQAKDSDAKALSDYLDTHAGTLDEPKPSLTLDPAAVSGKSGDRIGPITVHTSAANVDVALGAGVPAGVKIVDAAGKAVTTAQNGSQLYFQIPAGTSDGSTTVTVSATTEIAVGR
ncbi:thioester domain-containing protein, partial [Actinacidiphila acidipaludis]